MTTQAERHEKLTEDVRDTIANAQTYRNMGVRETAEAVLSLIAERLADMTEDMVEAICGLRPGAANYHDYKVLATKKWLAGLAASPINGGKEK